MAEEEVVVAAAAGASPVPSDLKRKHEDLKLESPEPTNADPNANKIDNESDSVKLAEGDGEEEPVAGGDSDESETKRPRLDEKSDGLVTVNGDQAEKGDAPAPEDAERESSENNADLKDAQKQSEDGTVVDVTPSEGHNIGDIQPPVDNAQSENVQEPAAEDPFQGDDSSVDQKPASETETVSRKMEVPNNKVGVLIGKAGDTIKFLQINSGAKIQITRDADSDPHSSARPVELIGTLESISKAEKLIKDVIAEADAGGSPSLVARGFSTIQAAGAAEQILIQVPNEKVGVIIGKGGETIKNLQTRSGARIQLIPQHLPEGDQSKERTVRVSGDKKQIEMAREMIKEVMNQPVRPSPLSGGYNQQQFRPRGPANLPQWGPRVAHPAQAAGYDYRQRGPYPSQNSQYTHQGYGNYPPQMAPRSGFGPGWEQRPSAMQGAPPPSGGGYDYYGGQGHIADAPTSVPQSNPAAAHGPGPSPSPMGPPPSQGSYNYGHPHGPEYGQAVPYSQSGHPQNYGHGYSEAKYENQAAGHHSYGGHGGSQPGGYPQGAHPGYSLHGPPQQYGQPRPSQPGDYQGHMSATQPYAQNAPPQQTYAYPSSGPLQQQSYPAYGSSANDGYNQQLPPASGAAPVYPQQGSQPVPGYGQPGGQQGYGYAQGGQTGGYVSYTSSQPGYAEQPAAGYYQGATVDPAYGSASSTYGAPPTGQAGYAQQAPPTQAGYDQSAPHAAAGYGSVPVGAPAGYGKSLSPQPQPGYPQYDSAQMYAAPR